MSLSVFEAASASCSMRRRRRVSPSGEERLAQVLGKELIPSLIAVDHASGAVQLTGWIGLPTASRAQPDQQFWFVNGRSVRDKLLTNAVRLGYRDVLYHGRHAAYVLLSVARSAARRCQRASRETRSTLPRQPSDSRVHLPRDRARAGCDAAGSWRDASARARSPCSRVRPRISTRYRRGRARARRPWIRAVSPAHCRFTHRALPCRPVIPGCWRGP